MHNKHYPGHVLGHVTSLVIFIHRMSHGRNIEKKHSKEICTQEKYKFREISILISRKGCKIETYLQWNN